MPDEVKPVIPAVPVAVQLKVVPVTFDVRFTIVVAVPEHTDWLSTVLLTLGKG